jgi:spore maturation protein CgeB
MAPRRDGAKLIGNVSLVYFFIYYISIYLFIQWQATLARAFELNAEHAPAQQTTIANGNVASAASDAVAASMNRLGDILAAGGMQPAEKKTEKRTVCLL